LPMDSPRLALHGTQYNKLVGALKLRGPGWFPTCDALMDAVPHFAIHASLGAILADPKAARQVIVQVTGLTRASIPGDLSPYGMPISAVESRLESRFFTTLQDVYSMFGSPTHSGECPEFEDDWCGPLGEDADPNQGSLSPSHSLVTCQPWNIPPATIPLTLPHSLQQQCTSEEYAKERALALARRPTRHRIFYLGFAHSGLIIILHRYGYKKCQYSG
jgi:hypothetical protein